jgi:hypothetical protein
LQGMLSDWPLESAEDWRRLVNRPMAEKEVERIRTCIARSRPYGRGCEKMGLAPSGNGENPGKSAVAKVPVPIFSQPPRGGPDPRLVSSTTRFADHPCYSNVRECDHWKTSPKQYTMRTNGCDRAKSAQQLAPMPCLLLDSADEHKQGWQGNFGQENWIPVLIPLPHIPLPVRFPGPGDFRQCDSGRGWPKPSGDGNGRSG